MSARERRIKEGLSSAEIELNGASKTLKELGFFRLSNEIELIKTKVQSIRINPDDLTVKRLQAINACIDIADSFDGLIINNQREEVITAIKLGRELKEMLTA